MDEKKLQRVLSKLQTFKGLPKKDEHLFETNYGYFANQGREYVIKTPYTPGLWANFLTNGKYTALITPTGGGYSWTEESGHNRVTREHPLRHLVEDTPGRYIFIKDDESDDYWSATHQPVKKSDNFKAIHSLGYTTSSTSYAGIEASVTYFVPEHSSHEIWWLKLKNTTKRKRTLKIYTYCEFVLGSYQPDILENSFNSLFTSGDRFDAGIFFTRPVLETKENILKSTYDKIGFFASSEPFTEYELSRRDFIGFGRTLENPQALEAKTRLTSAPRAGENLISCVAHDIILKPHEERQVFFALGVEKEAKEIHKITKNLNKKTIKAQFNEVVAFWDDYVKKVWIETPDTGLNIWFNFWLKNELHFNAHWSEMDSFYIGGGGGFGFRDTAQHIWGVLPFEKDLYLKHLRFLLSHQYPNGNVPHGVSIFQNKSVYSPHSDDACWLVFAILNYVEETNDLKFLHEIVPFADTGVFGKGHKGSILKHLIRAVDYSLRHFSERGIPQMRVADWNDALSTGPLGKGESFLVAGLLAFNLKRLVELLKKINRNEKMEEYTFAYKRLAESVTAFGWDGEWFLRATEDHQKLPIGSKKNLRGKIFLDSNTWLCISGIAGTYTKKTLNSLWDYLMTKYGALLFNPAYTTADKNRGVISQFVPGAKENAGIFLHANAWFMIALALGDEPDRAAELLKKINPVYQSFTNPDKYKVEPYVLPEFIFGNESDKFGEGSFTWVTGSAEWFFRGVLDYFLGLRPDYDKLIFEPHVPKDWNFKIERAFKGKRWLAEYKNGKATLKEMK